MQVKSIWAKPRVFVVTKGSEELAILISENIHRLVTHFIFCSIPSFFFRRLSDTFVYQAKYEYVIIADPRNGLEFSLVAPCVVSVAGVLMTVWIRVPTENAEIRLLKSVSSCRVKKNIQFQKPRNQANKEFNILHKIKQTASAT